MNAAWIPLAALALSLPPAPGGAPSPLGPREASWGQMGREVFDLRWIVPRAGAEELAASPAGTVDLVDELEAVLTARLQPRGDGTDRLLKATSLGDVLALFGEVRGDARGVEALLERVRRERPDAWELAGWALGELVREDRFLSRRWDPDEDRDDDGFLIVQPRDLALIPGGPWERVDGSTRAVQVATLIHADLEAIKAAENDFRTWPRRIGADYESIRPAQGSYLRGDDHRGEPFAALRVEFRCDLPFPFGGYDCDLRMLHRLDEMGRLVSDVQSSSEDFYWLAGHDLFLPVLDSQGEWVAMLCVRVFGCDLRGVPDSLDHHEAGAREGLGNMKREAERLWRSAAADRPVFRDSVPAFAVYQP